MPFRIPERISVELKKEFLRSNWRFINPNNSFETQLGLWPLRFRLCSRANMTKVLSTRRWHNTNHPWEVLIFILCTSRWRGFLSCWCGYKAEISTVKVPVVFWTNCLGLWTVDLTSRILSSVPPKYVQGSEMAFIGKNIHLSMCWRGFMAMCWHKGNLLSFAWRWVGYDVSRLLLLLTWRNSESHNFPKSPPMAPKLRTDTHKWQLR